MPALLTLDAPLTDGAVALRDYAERDIPEILIAYEDDPDLHVRMGQERPPSGAQLGRWAETEADERAAGVCATLTVLEAGSDVCRGLVTVHNLDWDHLRADIGMWIAPELRGHGLGRRALGLAARWVLESCGIVRLQVLTEPSNAAMRATAGAVGFTEEALLRGYERRRRGRSDVVMLSLLQGEVAAP
jgi:RimJ/RimL family protein N-acetyltransferase